MGNRFCNLSNGTTIVELTQGHWTICNTEDWNKISDLTWCTLKQVGRIVAGRTNRSLGYHNQRTELMHRTILSPEEGKVVDHINHDPLDNRRSNLRVCSHLQNNHNRLNQKGSRSPYKGVSWFPRSKTWRVRIRIMGKETLLGYSKDEKEAAKLYDKAAKKFFGEFACLNFP
jgi:hypothetical protein